MPIPAPAPTRRGGRLAGARGAGCGAGTARLPLPLQVGPSGPGGSPRQICHTITHTQRGNGGRARGAAAPVHQGEGGDDGTVQAGPSQQLSSPATPLQEGGGGPRSMAPGTLVTRARTGDQATTALHAGGRMPQRCASTRLGRPLPACPAWRGVAAGRQAGRQAGRHACPAAGRQAPTATVSTSCWDLIRPAPTAA